MVRVLLMLGAAAAAAQEAGTRGWSVLERALQAAGGREKLSAVRDMSFELQSRMVTPLGEMNVASRNQFVFPDTVRQDMTLPAGRLTIAFSRSEGWQQGPQGVQKIPPDQLRRTLAHLARVNILFRPPSDPAKVRWVSNEAVDGRGCEVIEITSLGDSLRLAVDRESGNVLKRAYRVEGSTGVMTEVEEFLSDFREVDGLRLAFKVREVRDGKLARESVTSNLRINTGIRAEELLREFQPGY
jgi:hypothetical protein